MYTNIYYERQKNLVHLWDSQKGYLTFPYTKYAYEKSPNGVHTSIFGDKLTKIYDFKKDDAELFESDVPETTRVLVDMYRDSDESTHGVTTFTFDIEVEMESGLPDVKEATNEITAIGFHDTKTKEYVVLVMDKAGMMQQKKTSKALVIPFKTEEDLLLTFLSMYEKISPDIITGWNIDFFDIPYLWNRLNRLLGEQQANRLSPIGQSFYSPYRQRFFLAGVSCIDYIHLYRTYNFGELPNYRLDTIGRKELGKGKIEYEGNLDELFNTDVEKFVEYNLVDVEIVVELDEKLQFIDLCRGICHAGHVPYEDFVYSSKYLEGALLTYLSRKNLVAPNKPADRREKMAEMKESGAEKFIGAYVKDPIVGKYDWVYDLDLTSLYPMIIITLNISPEAKVAKVEDWDAQKYLQKTQDTFHIDGDAISHENLGRFIKDQNLSIASNGVTYRKEKQGCIPGILSLWFDKRVEYKDLMKKFGKAGDDEKYNFYKKRQHVQKILLNSLYGVLGLPAFRFYDVDNAVAVTTTGRAVIQSTAEMCNIKYNKEIYNTERIVITDENGTEQEYDMTRILDIKRNGESLKVMARDLVEGDDVI